MFDFIRSIFGCSKSIKVTDENNVEANARVPAVSGKIKYFLNDPATPELTDIVPMPIPPNPHPRFTVAGFNGKSGKFGTKEWHAAQVYTVLCKTMSTVLPMMSRPITRWPGTRNLKIKPHAGVDLNAYYDRHSLQFFYAQDPKTRKPIYTCESFDIVSHELGHGILDAMRPDLWSIQSMEAWAYHEAFGDMVAILGAMHSDKMLLAVLKETNNDMFKQNHLTRLAEEMGTALYHYSKGKDGRKPGALRQALNKFKYKNPSKLPSATRHDKLANESHSFGRVFLGAFYAFLANVYKQKVKDGMKPFDAIKYARDHCGRVVMRASALAPASPRFYASISKAMLGIEKQMGGHHYALLKTVMKNRNIGTGKSMAMAMSHKKLSDIDITDADAVESGDHGTLVKQSRSKLIRLCDHFDAKAQSDNPLYEVEIEVPNDIYMEFDHKGIMVDGLVSSEKEVLDSARNCIHRLHTKNLVSDGPIEDGVFNQPFSILEGKLVRNFFI